MALNLRTIDKPLHDALKIWALGAGKNLDEFCVEILREALLRGTKFGEPVPVPNLILTREDVPKVVSQAVSVKGCKSCGGLNGMHQRGCKA